MTKAHIIQCPSGKFSFVGRVPAVLSYSGASEQELKDIAAFGFGIV